MITVTARGIKDFNRKLSRVRTGLLNKRVFSELGFKVIDVIDKRTEQGLDSDGRAFISYSPGYEEYKRNKGGRFFTGTVNLNDSGRMQSSITQNAENNRTTLLFSKTEEALKALGHNTGGGKLPRRNFFSTGREGKQAIRDYLRTHVKRLVK